MINDTVLRTVLCIVTASDGLSAEQTFERINWWTRETTTEALERLVKLGELHRVEGIYRRPKVRA